jgi:hypothetical protein
MFPRGPLLRYSRWTSHCCAEQVPLRDDLRGRLPWPDHTERCPSGLRSATGNRVGAERCLAGSNPALSAFRFAALASRGKPCFPRGPPSLTHRFACFTGETMFPPWAPFFDASLRSLHGGNHVSPVGPLLVCSRRGRSLLRGTSSAPRRLYEHPRRHPRVDFLERSLTRGTGIRPIVPARGWDAG